MSLLITGRLFGGVVIMTFLPSLSDDMGVLSSVKHFHGNRLNFNQTKYQLSIHFC